MTNTFSKINYLLDKRSKRQFLVLLIVIFLKSLLDGFGIGLIAPYIAAIENPDLVLKNAIFIEINSFLKINSKIGLVILLSSILIIFFIVKNIISLFITNFQFRLLFSKRSYQGRNLFYLYMRSPFYYHLEHNSAELDRNIRFENPNMYVFIQNILLLISNILISLSIFFVLLIASWKTVLSIGVIVTFVSIIFLRTTGKYIKKYGRQVQESQLHIGQAINEGLHSIIEAKLFRVESFFPNRYLKHMMDNARANWKQATLNVTPTLFFEVLTVVALTSVVMFLSVSQYDISSMFPIIGLFSLALIRLLPSITGIISSLQQIRFATPAISVIYNDFSNLNKLLGADYQCENPPVNIANFNDISIKHLAFTYHRSKTNVLCDLSLEIKNGQSIGFTGPSGSGKTTFINLLLGILEPTSGGIFVDGVNIHKNLTSWRSRIGYVPQYISLSDGSVKENVAFGLEIEDINENQVWKSLKEAHLDDFVKSIPGGINSVIGENGMKLSGGQRQRLGLARALYRDPSILVFDEATSSLDVKTERKITNEIEKLSGSRTVIIITHRISTLKNCNVIYYLSEGKIIFSGSYIQLSHIAEELRSKDN